jgi:hypothetical protein
MNHIMPGLIDDETRIENLYKDYKRFVKINSFIENFLHAPVEFMNDSHLIEQVIGANP